MTDGPSVTISGGMRAPALVVLLALLAPGGAAHAQGDPSRTHYLFAPSAFLLHGGEVVMAQTEIVMTSVALGIGDHVNLVAGSAMPALYALTRNAPPNLQLEVKAGFSPSEIVHLAAGFESLTLPAIMGGYAYGVVSVGRPSLHLTVGGGVPVISVAGSGGTGPPLLFAGGALGLGRHVVLATENWLFPTRPDLPVINAGLLRLLVWRFSIGLGAARVAPLRIPLPWVDLAVRVAG